MVLIACAILLLAFVGSSNQDRIHDGPLLSTFREVHQEFDQGSDGTYRFSFALPQQERQEERDSEGKVTGSFAFVDKVGVETSLKYDADQEGFQPESDALPQVPDETDDVQEARDEFLKFYEQTVRFLEALDSDEDSDSSSSEEESDEDEVSSEEDSDEEAEEDEEEGEAAPRGRFGASFQASRQSRRNFDHRRRPSSVYFERR